RPPHWWRATAGMRASGATSNFRQASMPAEAITAPVAGAKTIPRGDLFSDATALLVRAAMPERHHLAWGVVWLVLAAGLEALGPLIGKFLIDNYLLPRNARIPEIAALLLGALVAGTL